MYSWLGACYRATNAQTKIGLRLPAWMVTVGLEPQPISEATRSSLKDANVADYITACVRSLLPLILANGIATAEHVDLDVLAERLLAAGDGELVITIGAFTSVWGRKP